MYTVLYVDDESDLLDVGRLYLEESGDFALQTALSAPEALRLLERARFDAIISDYQMPGMDGIQFLIEVRKHFGSVPFILFTGRGREEIVIQALNEGADFYLQKGGEPEAQFVELSHKLKKAIESCRAEEDLIFKNILLSTEQETSPDGILIVDKDGKIINYNLQFTMLFGIPEDLIAPKVDEPVLQYVVRQMTDPEAFLSRVRYLYDHPEEKSFEELLLKDGRILERHSAPMLGKGGKYYGRVWYFRDVTGRKAVEEALKTERNRVEQYLDIAGVMLALLDREGTVTLINRKGCEILGYSREEIIGRNWFDRFLPEEIRGDVKGVFSRIMNGDLTAVEYYENAVLTKTNEKRIIAFQNSYLMGPDGITGLLSSGEDITERKQTEERLRESEANHLQVLNTIQETLSVIDPDGNFLFANNNAAYNLSGRTPEDVVGKNIREFVSQEQAEALKEKYRSVVISGEPLVQDVRISLKHRERWFHNNLKPIVFGPTRIPAVLSISLDITDRKQAEAALQEAGATLKFALRSARAGTWDWDFSSGKLTWSPEFYLLFNLPADSPPTFETWLMTLHPDDRKQAMDKIDQSVKEHLNLWNEYRIVLTDGSLRWIGAAGSTSYNDNGEPLRMSGICIDITGRKQAERALLESERKYRHIFTHAPLGFMQYDMEGTIVDCNEKFSEIIGAPKERLIGFNMLRGMKDGPARTALVNALETGTGYYEGPYHSVTGDKDVMMRALHQRLTDNSGATIGAISIFEDISERKTAEEALAENERKLNFVMDGVPALLAYIDADMRYVYVNKAYADWYGMTRDEITGKKIPDLLTKDVFERSLPNYQKVLSGIPVSYENRTTDRAGKERYVSVRLIPNFHNENVTGWFASIIDITDRKAVEEALRVSEERLRSTFASMDDLVFNLDENGIFTGSYNPVMENLYTSPEQFLGKPFRDVLPKELSDQIQKAITEIKNTGDTLQIEYSLPLHGDTAWFNASLSPCFSPEGAFSGVTIVARNITDHKRDEMALRESEQRHRLLADNASDVIWIMDPSGQFTYVSPSIGRLRGYTPEEVRHQSIDQQFTPASAAVAHRVLAEAFDEVRAGRRYLGFRGELEQPCKDGSTVWTEITTSGIYNEANEFVGVLGVGRDITKRRLVEEGLRQANKKLSLLSGITRHDINNQLTVLQGYLRLLEKKQDDPYKVERLQKAAAAAQNIASMIQFTKEYESIGIEAPIWQNCRTLVDSATQEIQLGKVIVRNDLLKDAEIFADPLIVKVFYNLMDNAMRYGERITLIRFFSREQENQHIIVCEDDGVGIPTEDKSKIFERGFGKNTGLGLYLAREILSMTGITIQETGTPGNGARFEITIPGEEYRISGTWPNHSIVHNNTLTTGDNH